MNIEHFEIKQRYIGHVEDAPMIWQKTSDDIIDIVTQTEAFVKRRIIENGSGVGVVIDTMENRVVSCFSMDEPSNEVEEAHIVDVVMRWIDD